MSYLILTRFKHSLIVLAIIVPLTFFGTLAMPGDAATAAFSSMGQASSEAIDAVRESYGLDAPVYVQFVTWAGNFVVGDWGTSFQTGRPVLQMFADRFPVTLELFVGGFIWSFILAVPAGLIAALRPDSLMDRIVTTGAMIGVSAPPFCVGIGLIYAFAVAIPIFPVSGYVPISESLWLNFKTFFLPTFVLGITSAGFLARFIRSNLLEILRQDFIRTARAKGLSGSAVLMFHAIKPAMISLITVVGLSFSTMIAGAFFVEVIFAIPGLGAMAVNALFAKDYPVIQAVLVLTAVNVLVVNLLIDLLYLALDPRVSLD